MSYEEGSGGSGSHTWIIVLSIVGGIILLVVLACGGLMWFGFRAAQPMMKMMEEMVEDVKKSQAAANSFLADLRADHIDGAYEKTSKGFKGRMNRKQFDDLIVKYPALKESPTERGSNVNPPPGAPGGPGAPPFGGGVFKYQYSAEKDDQRIEFTLTLIKEDDVLKVDELTVQETVKPKAAPEKKVEPEKGKVEPEKAKTVPEKPKTESEKKK